MGAPSDPNKAAEQAQAAAKARLEQSNERIQEQRIANIRRGSGAQSIGAPIMQGTSISGKPGSVPNTFGSAQPSASLFTNQKLGG